MVFPGKDPKDQARRQSGPVPDVRGQEVAPDDGAERQTDQEGPGEMTEVPPPYLTGREPEPPAESTAEEMVRLFRELLEEARRGRERMLTAQDVADYLQVNQMTIYKWVSEGRIPHIKFGKRMVRFDLDKGLSC